MSEHTTKSFDVDREHLIGLIAEMGGYTEKQIIEAVDALSRGDVNQGRCVILADATLDMHQREIEQLAIVTIAKRQPMAADLREVVAIIRIANDLERIGDLGANIGKRVIGINGEGIPRKALYGLQHMTRLVLDQLQDVLDCFAMRNSAKALDVWNRDRDVDSMYTSLFREMLTYMMEDPRTQGLGIHLMFCAKNIERMGDHVTNIAEAVYYMVEGRMLLDERRKADATSTVTVPFRSRPAR
jgi:phosphate transport system protein